MYPQRNNNKFLVKTSLLLILILGCFLATSIIWKAKTAVTNAEIQDGTTSTQKTPSPKTSTEPVFTGFDTLTARGLATDQTTGLKYAFALYGKTLAPNAKSVIVDTDSVSTPPRNLSNPDANSVVNFLVTVDQTPYKARVEYSGISTIWLFLTDPNTGAAVYTSGPVDINNQSPTN